MEKKDDREKLATSCDHVKQVAPEVHSFSMHIQLNISIHQWKDFVNSSFLQLTILYVSFLFRLIKQIDDLGGNPHLMKVINYLSKLHEEDS